MKILSNFCFFQCYNRPTCTQRTLEFVISHITIPFISQLSESEQQEWLSKLNKAMPELNILLASDIPQHQREFCQIAIVADPDPTQVSKFKGLKWIQSLWAGVEGLMKAFKEPSFSLVRLIDPHLGKTMAEAVLAWTLYLHRDMPAYRQQQAIKQWRQLEYTSAEDRTICFLGLVSLGQISAENLAQQGFNVLGWSQKEKVIKGIETYCDESGLKAMLAKCDIVICLLPLTPNTRHLLNAERFSYLPKGASVINFARGGIIQNEDLIEKLNSGHLKHAVLDVFEQEPLSSNSVYWQHDKITVLPHISAPTNPDTACEIVTANIQEYFKSGLIPPTVSMAKGY